MNKTLGVSHKCVGGEKIKEFGRRDLKELYSIEVSKQKEDISLYLNKRLFSTYNHIAKRLTGKKLEGVNIDLGCGDKGFSKYCESVGIVSYPYDYPIFDIEKDMLPHENSSIDFITMNAVIEHIKDPSNILRESYRVLKSGGFIFIRTPNWKLDWKNFYNDPTHVKPYSPETLRNVLELFVFEVIFLEPGLIEKNWFWWKLPDVLKWKVASVIKGGTKSIIAVGKKL